MKTQISKKELQEIHNIACPDWKKKISNFTLRNPFGDTIDFAEKEIEEMLKASTAEQLPIVKRIFDVVDSFEKIKTVEDAITYLGEVDDDVRQLRLLQNVPNLNRRTLAGQELIVINKALNEKTVLDWDNHNQYKYYIWWYMGKDFRLNCVPEYCSGSDVGSPFCLKSRELALYSANTFKEIWKDYKN